MLVAANYALHGASFVVNTTDGDISVTGFNKQGFTKGFILLRGRTEKLDTCYTPTVTISVVNGSAQGQTCIFSNGCFANSTDVCPCDVQIMVKIVDKKVKAEVMSR